jgi:hypothetical protein
MSEQAKSGIVQLFERVVKDGVPLVEVQADAGGGELLTLEHVDSCGEDAPPLAGDHVAISESTGEGAARSAGYADTKNPGVALGGEKRVYGRTPEGEVSGYVHFHGDGLIDIQGLAAGQRYQIGKVLIDADGNITTPGDITVKADTAPVKVSTHQHPTGVGPSGPPTPGT